MPVAQAHKYFKQLMYGVVSSFTCSVFLRVEFTFSLCMKVENMFSCNVRVALV